MNCNEKDVTILPTLFEEDERTVMNNADNKIIGYLKKLSDGFIQAKSVHGQTAKWKSEKMAVMFLCRCKPKPKEKSRYVNPGQKIMTDLL